MRKRVAGTVACIAGLCACLGGGAIAQTKAGTVRPLAIDDTELVCGKDSPRCDIDVRVEPDGAGGCKVSIDVMSVKIKTGKVKSKPLNFALVRGAMSDKKTYYFVSPGIVWKDSNGNVVNPDPDDFKFDSAAFSNTRSTWVAGKDGKKTVYSYEPVVNRVSDNRPCTPADPKIANDG